MDGYIEYLQSEAVKTCEGLMSGKGNYKITSIDIDFDNEEEIVEFDLNKFPIYTAENEEDLIEKITEDIGWCVNSVEYELVNNAPKPLSETEISKILIDTIPDWYGNCFLIARAYKHLNPEVELVCGSAGWVGFDGIPHYEYG